MLRCPRYAGQVVLCCPEDIKCNGAREGHELHSCCQLPLCRDCYFDSRSGNDDVCKVARCLANENFYGLTDEDLVKHRVRWIECAAASPVLTCLTAYYVEGDRGHLLDERIF